MFKRNPKESLRCFVTVDETWIHHYTPETKEQLKQSVETSRRAPKGRKHKKSAGKLMVTIFGDVNGIIYIDFLEKGKAITPQYYREFKEFGIFMWKKDAPDCARIRAQVFRLPVDCSNH